MTLRDFINDLQKFAEQNNALDLELKFEDGEGYYCYYSDSTQICKETMLRRLTPVSILEKPLIASTEWVSYVSIKLAPTRS